MFLNVIFLLFLSLLTTKCDEITNKLDIKIYYETLCPDSMNFFTNQLYPSMTNNNRLAYTNLKLIPYGKAFPYQNQMTQQKEVVCQHGAEECRLNALHACIIENVEFTKAFDVIYCLMRGFNTKFSQCAAHYGVAVEPVESCNRNRTEADILEVYGQQTSAIDLTFVPSIGIDGEFNSGQQSSLLYRFDRTFCRKYAAKFKQQLEGCQ